MGRNSNWRCFSANSVNNPEGREEETVTRLSRVGFDNTLGYLKGGINVWRKDGKSIDSVEEVDANEFEKLIKEKNN